MNKAEIATILAYLYSDWDLPITEIKVNVWHDQFGHIPKDVGMTAARLLMGKKTYGAPKAQDFREALHQVLGEELDWGTAWDLWVQAARGGRYQHERNMAKYELQCPLGAKAIGTMAREFYDMPVSQTSTFRAQFRQRFEALATRESQKQLLSPEISNLLEKAKPKRLAVLGK